MKAGHGRCALCKNGEETKGNLIMDYDYIKQVWLEVEVLTSLRNVWSVDSIEVGLRGWAENIDIKAYKALHVILAWGV